MIIDNMLDQREDHGSDGGDGSSDNGTDSSGAGNGDDPGDTSESSQRDPPTCWLSGSDPQCVCPFGYDKSTSYDSGFTCRPQVVEVVTPDEFVQRCPFGWAYQDLSDGRWLCGDGPHEDQCRELDDAIAELRTATVAGAGLAIFQVTAVPGGLIAVSTGAASLVYEARMREIRCP